MLWNNQVLSVISCAYDKGNIHLKVCLCQYCEWNFLRNQGCVIGWNCNGKRDFFGQRSRALDLVYKTSDTFVTYCNLLIILSVDPIFRNSIYLDRYILHKLLKIPTLPPSNLVLNVLLHPLSLFISDRILCIL